MSSSLQTSPLRFGIIGLGGIAGLHAECLRRLHDEGIALLVAGADPNAGQRAKFAETWRVATVASLDELLQRDDIDAVTITSPSGLHGDQAIAIATFVAIGSVTVVGAVLFFVAAPGRAARPLGAIREFMADNNATIMMMILLILGFKVLGDALSGFGS